MSFITKRERVFNEYELFDLPARNEGKLKAYASCTDARAWSHFCSDKSEHLVEIIKRNNEIVRPKYLPTKVIVDTLMVTKNAEIARLKKKIEEFEQMLAAYDQLDLSCDQKCEIAAAHAAIKAANKELDEMCLDLDLSGFTEALDSEGFETGKSGGDTSEIAHQIDEEQQVAPVTDAKAVQMGTSCTCDVATHAEDPRIEEMEDIIISKDAKLNAMKNSIAVMENGLCEPYCIYAHIYTALEIIFGVLCQNDKYRQYLNLLTAGKDTRCIDIRGRILFKLKVFEKFCQALIAPCNQEFPTPSPTYDCACYRSEVATLIETNYVMTAAEATQPNIDNKRAHLVADIIENEEMKDILSKESFTVKHDVETTEDVYTLYDINIDTENLQRLKKLQENYDDLMTCYETLKHEKDCLAVRCQKYEELEGEFENLKLKIKEYNSLWNEKEHYRKRSDQLDTLKEQYLILADETASLETQLKAESEINHIKCKAIDDLRNENVRLEKKLNDAVIAFEKEKSGLLCKLKEADCKMMCQGQQIKSLSIQIDCLLEQDQKTLSSRETENHSIALIDEIESSRDQIKNLKDALFCNEEEKQNLQQQYQDQLKLITDLRNELEDWKTAYEKTLQRNDYLEKYTESLVEETRVLSRDAEEKSKAVDNLIKVVNNKSQEINKLITEVEKSNNDNKELSKQVSQLKSDFNTSVASLENEKVQTLKCLQLAREESQELLEKVKNYDEMVHSKADVTKSLEIQIANEKELQELLLEENQSLKMDLTSSQNNNTILLQEIKRLQQVNEFALDNISGLQVENKINKTSFEIAQKESSELKIKLNDFENFTQQLQRLQESHSKLIEEKNKLELELIEKSFELENAIQSIQLTKRESHELMDKLQHSENTKDELSKLSNAYQKLVIEKHSLQTELLGKSNEIANLLQSLNDLKLHNEHLQQKCRQAEVVKQELQDIKKLYDELLSEKNNLMKDFTDKKEEVSKLQNMMEKKIEEIHELTGQITCLQENQNAAKDSIKSLQDHNLTTQATLNVIKTESAALLDKIKYYETMETEYDNLKQTHDEIKIEKEKLQYKLNTHLASLKRMEQENFELHCQSQNLITHNEDLENALMSSRTELMKISSTSDRSYTNIFLQIEEMKHEKLENQKKIRDLRDKLDESESIISNLNEDVMARDDKIAILENHINELESEVRKLHINLAEAVSAGEEMKDFSYQKVDSIKTIEAHHSKATHNMKMELAKLQQQHAILEEQLSVTKMKSEESSRASDRYISQSVNNEREIIVAEIKDLEISSTGESILGPTHSNIDDILMSLDRIRKCLDASNSKSAFLEQTISKVQTSSQLLSTKADEAKKLVEKEKQKIVNEKEDAIKDRQMMEKQLIELKEKYKQISQDRANIQDLEGTILNQKLIINKVNKSTQEYISKLKEELHILQGLYQNSMEKISELQGNLQNVTEEKNSQNKMLEEFKKNFDLKSQEIQLIQDELEKLQNKPVRSFGTQTTTENNCQDVETQVKDLLNKNNAQVYDNNLNTIDKGKMGKELLNIESKKHNQDSDFQENQNATRINEVQVLTVKVEPSFDYVRNSYTKYKIKCLSTGRLEQYSISCPSDIEINKDYFALETAQGSEDYYSDTKSHSPNLVDIYNRQSLLTNSSKVNPESQNIISNQSTQKQSSGFIAFVTTDNSRNNNEAICSNSPTLLEKDLFVIYKDSQTSSLNRIQDKHKWSETIQIEPDKNTKYDGKHFNGDSFLYTDDDLKAKKGRHKLKIKMPRVENMSNNSLMTTTDGDKKSLSSYTMALYSSPKHLSSSDTKINENGSDKDIKNRVPIISNGSSFGSSDFKDHVIHREILRPSAVVETDKATVTNVKHKIPKKHDELSSKHEQSSHHKLSRVDANVLLLKNNNDTQQPEEARKNTRDFGLEYILNSVQDKVTLNKPKSFTNNIRAVKSDEILKIMKSTGGNINSSHSKLSDLKITSNEYKTLSTYSKTSNKSQKIFTEQSVMVKLDSNSDYENTISTLTKALKNIERDNKMKIEAIKMRYDNNIKCIINDHNQGVKSLQGLHEDKLQNMIKVHENEVENLRSLSIEVMRKAKKLERENKVLKSKITDHEVRCLDEEPITPSLELKKRKCRADTKVLTKTTVDAFNMMPKPRGHGPCTCSLDVNISDTIRNIFEQVDIEQRKMVEHTYMKYIANKMLNGNIEHLDAQELSFLHLNVCRTWKTKLSKEETLQKRIDSLEIELVNKQKDTQQHIADLDRKVAEERRRLQEACDAVCRVTPHSSRPCSPDTNPSSMPPPPPPTTTKNFLASCTCNADVTARGSAGDLTRAKLGLRPRRTRNDSDKAVARLALEDRREKKLYNDELPTRLRRSHDRQTRPKK